MIAFLRELAAAPFMVLFFAANFLKLPISTALARGAWVVSGQIQWAQTWIWQMAKTRGPGQADGYADDLIRKTRDARIPGALGLYEYALNHNSESAYQWARKGDELCTHHKEALLSLKMMLSSRYQEYNTATIAEAILQRNDLPMDQSRIALLVQIFQLLDKKDWFQADARISHMLSVEEIPVLYCARWTVYMAQGRQDDAQQQLALAEKKLAKSEILRHQASGFYLLDRIEDARQYLKNAVEQGLDVQNLSFHEPKLAELLSEPETKANSSQPEGV
jgi:tetratricopeptide (TPR) repeat protein